MAETLGEDDVIRIARTRDPEVLTARATASVAESEEISAGLYPNPSLAWEREQSPGQIAQAGRQDSLFLTLPIDLGGRRTAQTAMARSGAKTAHARVARTQSDAVARSLFAFHDALFAGQEVQIATQAVARLDEAARVVGRRHEAGSISGYERARLELEAELERSRLQQSKTRARMAHITLAAMLGIEATTLELRGDFATPDLSRLAPPTHERPSITFLRAAEAEARRARNAAGWTWIPTLALTGGLRFVEATDGYGYVAGLSLSLPIFSSGQELRAESSARQLLADAEVRAAERGVRAREVRAREQLVSARQEITRFAKATSHRALLLERAVQSGYREGDRSAMELVDAQRARTEVDRRRLELEWIAKQAEIELRVARGEFE